MLELEQAQLEWFWLAGRRRLNLFAEPQIKVRMRRYRNECDIDVIDHWFDVKFGYPISMFICVRCGKPVRLRSWFGVVSKVWCVREIWSHKPRASWSVLDEVEFERNE